MFACSVPLIDRVFSKLPQCHRRDSDIVEEHSLRDLPDASIALEAIPQELKITHLL